MKCKKKQFYRGLTLLEVIVVLMLAGLILMAVLGVYNRVRASAAVIMDRLDQNRLQNEIIQKISEDIDRMVAPGFNTTIRFSNKLSSGYHSSRLVLQSNYYGNTTQQKVYERIIWQTSYDALADSLTLYRMHDGLNVEDKVLEQNPKSSPSAGLFIPVASGVTYFEFKAQQGETVLGAWSSAKLPKAARIGISFAPMAELEDGSIGVPEEGILFRTIAIDRTRLIPYQFVKKQFDLPEEEVEDPNDVASQPEEAAGDAMDLMDEVTDRENES